jgi:hypothetical protein
MESRQSITEPQLPPPQRSDGADDFFREVNDRILELGDRFGFREEALELICECEDAACTGRISIFAAEFAELRDTDGLHLIAEGHGHMGRVVRRGAGYVVVAD